MLDSIEYIYIAIGLIVVLCYSWQRFDEPSFSNEETLPHTVEPIQYLFAGRAYQKARFVYLCGAVLFYTLLILPGAQIARVLPGAAQPSFSLEAWPLLVALILVGFVPNSNMEWLTVVERRLRRGVHEFFLVPTGIVRTIGVLEYADFDPPANVLIGIGQGNLREKLQNDLGAYKGSLEYKWARATLILGSLDLKGRDSNPLVRASFAPFEKDLDDIRDRYRQLDLQMRLADRKEQLEDLVDKLLKRMYAYIAWGVRRQSKSERVVFLNLERLGFDIPPISSRRVFDVVAPAALLVSLITFLFWISHDIFDEKVFSSASSSGSISIVSSLSAAMAAAFMYGYAVFIALNSRSRQIEDNAWVQTSPRCYLPIAIRAGLVSWLIIIVSTVVWFPNETGSSVVGMWNWLRASEISSDWRFLPERIATALPWFVAGAAASCVIAVLLAGDVRGTTRRDRECDALVLGGVLGLAVAFAADVQGALGDFLDGKSRSYLEIISAGAAVGLAGAACGAVIGFMVPKVCKSNIVTPFSAEMIKALDRALQSARASIGDDDAAKTWLFTPRNELGGISPAEAVQHTQLDRVKQILADEAQRLKRNQTVVQLNPVGAKRGRAG
jgi:hypothetical protein